MKSSSVDEAKDLGDAVVDRETRQGVNRDAQHYYEREGGAFKKDRESPDFWLGPVVGFHEIGEYGIIEYAERTFRRGRDYGKLTGRHCFSVYINGHSISRSACSLDQALVTAIAYKRDGCNSQAARFFLRATEPECL